MEVRFAVFALATIDITELIIPGVEERLAGLLLLLRLLIIGRVQLLDVEGFCARIATGLLFVTELTPL